MNKRKQGAEGENLAVAFLEKKGYRVLDRNYRFERGEIDIVAEDNGVLVFIEVKARSSKTFGEPEDAVTESKQRRIKNAAEGYLFEHNIDDKECRFDVIAIEYEGKDTIIRHLEDAF